MQVARLMLLHGDIRLDVQEQTLRSARKTLHVRVRHHEAGAVSAHSRPRGDRFSGQLLASGNSAAANYEEADDGSSVRDRLAKARIALRELKETRLRLRVLRATGILTEAHDPVVAENIELIKIVATIHPQLKKLIPSWKLEFGTLLGFGIWSLGFCGDVQKKPRV